MLLTMVKVHDVVNAELGTWPQLNLRQAPNTKAKVSSRGFLAWVWAVLFIS